MKMYNDLVSTSTTSSSLDKETWEIYENRHSSGTGSALPEEDTAPYILPSNASNSRIKKIFM